MKKDATVLSIILLNYNGYKDTLECIKSIKENEKNIDYRIIVVDNNSTDNSINFLSKLKDITLIERNINDGFAAGNNVGIKYALDEFGSNYILLLNNDTIVTKNCLSKMLDSLKKDKSAGIATCKLMKTNNKEEIDCYGGKINWNKVVGNFNYVKKQNDFYYSEIASGACMLIKKEVFEKIGYLSEDYFMYFEDLDYSVRAIEADYKIQVVPEAIIYHKGGATAGKASPFAIKWNTRNRIIFYKKFKKYVNRFYFLLFFPMTRIIYFLKYILICKFEFVKALKNGIIYGIRWRENNEK